MNEIKMLLDDLLDYLILAAGGFFFTMLCYVLLRRVCWTFMGCFKDLCKLDDLVESFGE